MPAFQKRIWSVWDLEQSQEGVVKSLNPALLRHTGTGSEDPPGWPEHVGEFLLRSWKPCAQGPASKSQPLWNLACSLPACSGTSGLLVKIGNLQDLRTQSPVTHLSRVSKASVWLVAWDGEGFRCHMETWAGWGRNICPKSFYDMAGARKRQALGLLCYHKPLMVGWESSLLST